MSGADHRHALRWRFCAEDLGDSVIHHLNLSWVESPAGHRADYTAKAALQAMRYFGAAAGGRPSVIFDCWNFASGACSARVTSALPANRAHVAAI